MYMLQPIPTTQQLGDILDGIESIVIQLEELGLSETDINELFITRAIIIMVLIGELFQ